MDINVIHRLPTLRCCADDSVGGHVGLGYLVGNVRLPARISLLRFDGDEHRWILHGGVNALVFCEERKGLDLFFRFAENLLSSHFLGTPLIRARIQIHILGTEKTENGSRFCTSCLVSFNQDRSPMGRSLLTYIYICVQIS